MGGSMSVGRVATRTLATAGRAEPVSEAARRIADTEVGCGVVCLNGTAVGILTERDIVTRVVARGLDPATTRIADVMTPEPRSVDESASEGTALEIMDRGGVRRLVVTAEGGGLLGVVRREDLVAAESPAEARRPRYLIGAPSP